MKALDGLTMCVSGENHAIVCAKAGSWLMGKKTPENKNIGAILGHHQEHRVAAAEGDTDQYGEGKRPGRFTKIRETLRSVQAPIVAPR